MPVSDLIRLHTYHYDTISYSEMSIFLYISMHVRCKENLIEQ